METRPPETFHTTADLIAAEAPDLPAFLFSEHLLRTATHTFASNFNGIVTYAVKANPSDQIMAILAEEGLTAFDVASVAEMEVVRRNAPDAALHYNNPIRSRRDIEAAWNIYHTKSYTIDHPAQLDQIAAIVPASKDVEITIRFKAGKARKAYDFGTKFGISEGGAVTLLKQVADMGYAPSLCFHVGSQCEETYAYERHIVAAGRIAQKSGVALKRLNVGGGFPASYPSSGAPDLSKYFETIRKAVAKTFGATPPDLIIEPGRALVTSSTSLLLRVRHQRAGRAVYLNDGAYGALMEVKFMPIVPATRVWRGNTLLGGPTAPFTVFGPTCDSYDSMPRFFDLPKTVDEDDWIEFAQMGAYSQASVTDFNGFSERLRFNVSDIHT